MKQIKLTEEQLKEAKRLITKKGGDACFKKYGKDHYVKMINKRWAKRKKVNNSKPSKKKTLKT